MAAEADSTVVVEAGSTVAGVVFMAASAAGDIPGLAAAGGRLAGRIAAGVDSGLGPLVAPRIEARWALGRLQARVRVSNRARGSAQAWPAGVSVARAALQEFAMPSRTANGIRLEAPAA